MDAMTGAPSETFGLHHELLTLHLRHTFTIARSSEDIARTLLLRVSVDGLEGLGESSPVGRYSESAELVAQQLDRVNLADANPWHFDTVLDRVARDQRGAMCALDIALHDLAGKRLGVPVYQMLGLDPALARQTSFTIGIADIETMLTKAREALHLPIFKVKIGKGNEIETLEALRSVYSGTIRVDANEAWTPEQAVKALREIDRLDIEFCEQPIKAGHPEQLRFVRERSPIPIVVDEDCRTLEDIAPLHGCVDGINIKLVKCGGMREAVRMIHAAHALGMKVMIGCMIESSILCTAAAQLTPLVEYADVDGPLLITDDPYQGVAYDGAQLRLPDAPGLGVRPRSAA
ncbi:MAG: dipeptide epimerase [Candidatus Eremiobacteraeota bacterium]|nr:dipeptide epimerase [Candidatus Eremiobacteraeota bacterium]MBC5827185.1 dipeptide epimerase [Candidatus Eremiobacteraeota bacterium]